MNPYIKDGIHLIRRASGKQLDFPVDRDDLKDGVVLFAFGIEKFLKGMLWDVNPFLVYQEMTFKTACVMYQPKLTEWARQRLKPKKKQQEDVPDPDEPETSLGRVHAGNQTITRASHFSQVVTDRAPTLRSLFQLRGTVAHRTDEEFDQEDARYAINRDFYPLVMELAAEQGITDISQFFAPGKEEVLRSAAECIAAIEADEKKYENTVKEHREVWERRRKKQEELTKARAQTKRLIESEDPEITYIEAPCPVCEQTALLLIADYYQPDSGDSLGDPGYVVGLQCCFCDLRVTEPEMMERFYLAQLYDSVYADT